MLCQTTALKMSASLPIWLRAGRRHADALGVDHLAHHAAGAVGGADQHLGLFERQVAHRAGTVVVPDLRGGDLLQAAEQGVAAGVGAGQEDAQPAEHRREERVEDARLGEGDAERRVHAGVLRDVAQAEHEGDRRDRDLHLPERSCGRPYQLGRA